MSPSRIIESIVEDTDLNRLAGLVDMYELVG